MAVVEEIFNSDLDADPFFEVPAKHDEEEKGHGSLDADGGDGGARAEFMAELRRDMEDSDQKSQAAGGWWFWAFTVFMFFMFVLILLIAIIRSFR